MVSQTGSVLWPRPPTATLILTSVLHWVWVTGTVWHSGPLPDPLPQAGALSSALQGHCESPA